MLKHPSLELLRVADPVAVEYAAQFAAAVDLHARVFAATASLDDAALTMAPLLTAAQKRRRMQTYAIVGAVVLVAVALVVAPAFGLFREVLPFFGAPKAPQPVQIEFRSMNTGAPAGMSPQAVAADTREIGEFDFGGRSHTLWVALTRVGGFCFEWIGGWGGCTAPHPAPLTWNGDLVVPPGVSVPTIPKPGSGADPAAIGTAIRKARSLAVPTWVSGYVIAADAQDVLIKFSDGTTVHPAITWVSPPIDAGFFAYDIPGDHATEANHLVGVDALSAAGAVVKEQPLRP